MKASTDAATEAAKAARDSVTLARQASHLDQRAWLLVRVEGIPEENKPFEITLSVR